jgi:hypothetical protein
MDFAPPLKEPAEDTPLLGEVPQEVITSSSEFRSSGRSIRNRRFSIVSIGSIFSDVRSEEEISKEEIQNESEIYLASSMLARGECCSWLLSSDVCSITSNFAATLCHDWMQPFLSVCLR